MRDLDERCRTHSLLRNSFVLLISYFQRDMRGQRRGKTPLRDLLTERHRVSGEPLQDVTSLHRSMGVLALTRVLCECCHDARGSHKGKRCPRTKHRVRMYAVQRGLGNYGPVRGRVFSHRRLAAACMGHCPMFRVSQMPSDAPVSSLWCATHSPESLRKRRSGLSTASRL